ncbi:MAG: dimethylarginine dimethylaminohydrolase family protein, partial [bacterium]
MTSFIAAVIAVCLVALFLPTFKELIMSTTYQSEIGTIKSLVLKHARDAFASDAQITKQWQALKYHQPPDYSEAIAEFDCFADLFRDSETDIHFLPADLSATLDSIYVRDAAVVCNKGAILCNMGKAARLTEPAAEENLFRQLGIPIVGKITSDGKLEGGDCVWIDEKVLAVGRGYRSNDEGICQLKALLGDCVEQIIIVQLPHYKGPSDVFHLMSIFSPLDKNKALVYSPLMPVAFREFLLDNGMEFIEVPEEEFASMACNVLALAPGKCIMLEGNPKTQNRLEKAGIEVYTYKGDEISRKGEGGPTCLTRPLL